MAASRIRLTTAVLDVLGVLVNTTPDSPAWGLRICDLTGLGSGTIYPVLERLERAGWIEGRWEAPSPADRPRRRFYELTSAGRAQIAQVTAARERRRLAWEGAAGQSTSA